MRAHDVPQVPCDARKGQQVRYRVKAVNKEGKKWYQSHDKMKYYLDILINDDSLRDE